MTSACCKFAWTMVFVAVAVGGALAAVFIPAAAHQQLVSGVRSFLRIDSPSQKGWDQFVHSLTKVQPQYYDLYAFDLRNPDEFLAGAKPIFKEVGPFTFRLHQEKIDVTPSDDGSNVSYKMWQYVVPEDPAAANMSITIPNLMLWAVAGATGANTTVGEDLVWTLVETLYGFKLTPKEMAFQRRTVDELFFGYHSDILQRIGALLPGAGGLPPRFPGLLGNASSPAAARNQTGTSVQLTGLRHPDEARQYVQWNGMKSLRCCTAGPCGSPDTAGQASKPAWPAASANDLTRGAGTSGTQFASFLPEEGSEQSIFVDSLVRSAVLSSKGQAPVTVAGIPCQRFVIPKRMLENTTYNPANSAYGMSGLPSGLMDLQACEGGVPIVVSKAHFLDADPALWKAIALEGPPAVDGRARLDTHLDVDPVTGTTMRVAERLQINMRFGPFGSNIPAVRKLVYPLGWLDKRAVVTPELAKQWHDGPGLALTVKLAATIAGAAVAGLAMTGAAICGLMGARQACSEGEEEPKAAAVAGGWGDSDVYASLDSEGGPLGRGAIQ